MRSPSAFRRWKRPHAERRAGEAHFRPREVVKRVLRRALLTVLLAGGVPAAAQDGHWRSPLHEASSPYLRKHADNPVRWRLWNASTLEEAVRLDRPIFLSIGYAACYWCHVMERESFRNAEVAQQLNTHFVAIKVDRDERPDVDRAYQRALIASGTDAGWPSTLLLLPDGRAFVARTYLGRDELLSLLEAASVTWRSRRSLIHQQASTLERLIAAADADVRADEAADPMLLTSLPADTLRTLTRQFDAEYGGFGEASKFPQAPRLDFLMACASPSSLDMARKTLQAVALGGLHDIVGGGFHRYATDRQWRTPHYEKMLSDQAQLLGLFSAAYRRWGDPSFREAVNGILRFVDTELRSPDGLWFAATSAHSSAGEGAYYRWREPELDEALGADRELLESLVTLDDSAGGGALLRWRTSDDRASQLERWVSIRERLAGARRRRVAPDVDRQIVTGWNALMIRGLVDAAIVFDDEGLLTRAAEAMTRLTEMARSEEGLRHVVGAGPPDVRYLEDYAAVGGAAVRLADAGAGAIWEARAVVIADEMLARFWNAELHRFEERDGTSGALPYSARASGDAAEPAASSLAIIFLADLVDRGLPRYRPYLARALRGQLAMLASEPAAWPSMLGWFCAPSRVKTLRQLWAPESSGGRVSLTVEPGENGGAAVLRIDDGWHIQGNPVALEGLVATELRFADHSGDLPAQVRYPEGEPLTIGAQSTPVYSGVTRIAYDTGTRPDRITAVIQACDDTGRCLAPDRISYEILP